MSQYKTPQKKRVRINEQENMERLDSGKLTKQTRKKELTVLPEERQKSLFDDGNEKYYGVEPGGLMTGPELSNMYENYTGPNRDAFENLWGTDEFKPNDDFSNELLGRHNKKQRYSGGKKSRKSRKSRKYRKSRKSKKSRKTRKTKRKH
jgi:hypothetical protein